MCSTKLLILILVASVLFPGGPALAQSQPATTRPNLVLFIADDLTWNDVGAYGSPDARTPNVDRLAKESLKFDLAFAASPTCTPSRSSLYTGLYPMRNGAHANHSWINEGVRTLPEYLGRLGYRVVIAGKTHIGPRVQFPFEYLADSNVMPPGKHHVLWTDLNTAAVEKLLATHDQEKPLCLIVCAHSPHVYWMDNQGYDPAKLTLPPYLFDTPETRATRCKYLTDVSHMDQQLGDVLASLEKHGYADKTLMMFTADQGAQWPLGKWNLYDEGIHAPLLVRWPGHTKAGATTGAMVSLVDVLPTFMAAAGVAPPSDLDGRSFLPVIEGKADAHREKIFAAHTGDGQMNRSPMRAIRTRQYKYILNLKPADVYKTHIDAGNGPDGRVYWDTWVKAATTNPAAADLIRRYQHRPAEELYDVAADPYEQHNLAGDAGHAQVLSDLREKLKQWRLQQGEDLTKIPMPEDGRTGELRYAG